MTPAQKAERLLVEHRAKIKAHKLRLGELSVRDLSDLTGDDLDASRAELRQAEEHHVELLRIEEDLERQQRLAKISDDAARAEVRSGAGAVVDGEVDHARLELRNRCRVGAFLKAHMQGRSLSGAEAELSAELGLDGGIPMELWDQPEQRAGAVEQRAVTGAPATVGVNLDTIRPAIFAPSILPRLGVEMPRVGNGTYASATITTSTTAATRAKSADAPATAAGFAVTTATPKRISARLELTLEDIEAVGQENFESALRDNLSMALSDQLDSQGLNGNGTAPNLQGLIGRLTDPTDPSDVADWAAYAGLAADHVDGLWSSMESDVALLVNVDAYRLACKTFRQPAAVGTPADTYADTPGEMSAAAYISKTAGGFWTNSRMPATASNIAIGVAHRRGRMGIRTAVCPVWSEVAIDDWYSGSSKAERYVTLHVLCGDVIVVQPGAYSRFDLKVS